MSNEKAFLVEADMINFEGTEAGSHSITEVVGVALSMAGADRLKKAYDVKNKDRWPSAPYCSISEIELHP